MSGHSKWSKIKHQKETTDAVKGKIFTKLGNVITLAVREGGGSSDPQSNFKLRLAIEKAHQHNMPKANIDRALERAIGVGDGNKIEEIIYEGMGPSGVGLIIVATTDNKQRTVAEIKNILERGGGALTPGAVMPLYEHAGLIRAQKGVDTLFDKVMELSIDKGALDIAEMSDEIEIYTRKEEVHKIKMEMEQTGLKILSYELIFKPTVKIKIEDIHKEEIIESLIHRLEESDDIQKVYSNHTL